MIPKRATDEIPGYAAEKGVPVQDMQDMVIGYYRALRELCSDMGAIDIAILGLGWMSVSKKKLSDGLKKEKKIISSYNGKIKDDKYRDACKQVEILRIQIARVNQEWKREREKRKEKTRYKIAKQKKNDLERNTGSSMEEPESDS